MGLLPPPKTLTREAQLVYGGMGSGKTTALLHLRRLYATTGTAGHFYVASTELESFLRCAQEYDDFVADEHQPFPNLTVVQVTDYESLVETTEQYNKAATESDWLAVDSLSDPQEWARDTFFLPQMGMRWSEFARSGRKMLDVPSHGWKQMRETYNDWFVRHFLNFAGHRFATARSKALDLNSPWSNNEAGKAKRTEYGHIGYHPVGAAEIGYPFHTVLYTAQSGPRTRTLTTAKDRAREYLTDKEWDDFGLAYLFGVTGGPAGWVAE